MAENDKESDAKTQLIKAQTTDSEFRPLSPGTLRLYSMRFCPYAQRVRLILAAKSVDYEVININLKKKPEWYSSKVNAQQHVPAIQHDDGRSVHESLILAEYLDSIYPKVKLYPEDPFKKAECQMLIEAFQRIVGLLFKAVRFKKTEAWEEMETELQAYENTLKEGKFFGDDKPNIVDYMIWPWFERFRAYKAFTKWELDRKRFVNLDKWVSKMVDLPAVKETKRNPNTLLAYYKVSLQPAKEPNYDLGLPGADESPERVPPPPPPAEEDEKPKEEESSKDKEDGESKEEKKVKKPEDKEKEAAAPEAPEAEKKNES